MPDIEALSSKLFDAVKDYLGRSLKSFTDRLDATEAKLAEFRQPADGKDGVDGKDGISVDPAAVAAMVADQVATIPRAEDGKNGVDGKDGANGKDGKDVDPTALDELRASVSDMLKQAEAAVDSGLVELAAAVATTKALPVAPASFFINENGDLMAVYPDGSAKSVGVVRGKDGTRGASIMDGTIDSSGQLTMRMSDGRVINVGTVRGEPGKPGETREGKAGRDAAEIKPLPAIDETKSYPEGTYAAYRGGLIRSERATDPIVDENILKSGWRAVMVGIAEESEVLVDDGRYVERTTTYTDGTLFKRKEQTSTMIYRGVWADKDFTRGDTVTWDGSLWHCEKKTREKPGVSSDWKLVAKRGRDGKDSTKH